MVSMQTQTAFQTMVNTNRQIFFNSFAAGGTVLTCEVRLDFYQHLISVFSFIFQLLKESRPRYIVNLFAQNSFTQSDDVQIFNRYQIVLFDQHCRNLVLKIVSLVLNLSVNFSQMIDCFSPLIRAFFAARNFSLRSAKFLLSRFVVFEIVYLCAVRQSYKRFNSSVQTDSQVCFRQRLNFVFNCEYDKPTRNFTFNCASFNFAFNRAGQSKANRSDFREHQPISDEFESALRKTKTVESFGGFESWKTRFFAAFNSSEKRFESFINSFENVLQDLAVYFGQIVSNVFDVRKLIRLVKIVERNSIQFESIAPFLQSRIIQLTTQTQTAIQLTCYLFIWRESLVFERLHRVKYNLLIMKKQVLNTLNHSVFSLQYHLVFVTKYRRKCISPEMLERLREIFRDAVRNWKGELIEFNGESDHVHLLISLNPKLRLSDFVGNMKTVSSRLIRKEFSEELAEFYWKPVFWSGSYCILTCGGAPLSVIKQYIENQRAIDADV